MTAKEKAEEAVAGELLALADMLRQTEARARSHGLSASALNAIARGRAWLYDGVALLRGERQP